MAGIVEPDNFLLRSVNGLGVVHNQGRAAIGIVSSFKKEDRFVEVQPELTQVNFHDFWKKDVKGKHLAAEETEIIRERISGG
jgi:hypothetical protein